MIPVPPRHEGEPTDKASMGSKRTDALGRLPFPGGPLLHTNPSPQEEQYPVAEESESLEDEDNTYSSPVDSDVTVEETVPTPVVSSTEPKPWEIELPDYQPIGLDEDEEDDNILSENSSEEDVANSDTHNVPSPDVFEPPARQEPITGSYFPGNDIGEVVYAQTLTERDLEEEEPTFPINGRHGLDNGTFLPLGVTIDADEDNAMLRYDPDEDFDEPLEDRRKRLMREVRITSDTEGEVPVPSEVSVRHLKNKKPMSKGSYIGGLVAVALLASSGTVAYKAISSQRQEAAQQALVDSEYAQDAPTITSQIACVDNSWDIREDNSTDTKNITCLDKENPTQVLYSRGLIDESRVWPRAANLLTEDAFVVTDHQHWGAIAKTEEALRQLAQSQGLPICTLKKGANLNCA